MSIKPETDLPWRWCGVPAVAPGMRIGLFGGSFNPPHAGHVLVAERMACKLGLDQVWWLATPGNPLKDRSLLAPLVQRLDTVEAIINPAIMRACGFEACFDLRYTYQTVDFLKRRCGDTHFVLLLGADSFASLHQWRRWRHLTGSLPLAVYNRPGYGEQACNGVAAHALHNFRHKEQEALSFCLRQAPAWIFISGPLSHLSSTRLRLTRATAFERTL